MEKVLTGWDHEGLWVDVDCLLRVLDFCTLFSTCQHVPGSSSELINSYLLALIDRGYSFAPLKVVEAGVSLHIYVGSIGYEDTWEMLRLDLVLDSDTDLPWPRSPGLAGQAVVLLYKKAVVLCVIVIAPVIILTKNGELNNVTEHIQP